MKKVILFFFLLLQNLAFGQVATLDTVVLRIDPEIAVGGISGKIYNEVTYIPLQNSKECVIGEISKLEVVDKFYIVYDRGLDQIVIFNQDGSYHAKCVNIPGLHKNSGMANNFNFNIFGDLAINRLKQEIFVKTNLDRENLYVFNYEGSFKRKVPLEASSPIKRFSGFAFLDSTRCVYNLNSSSLQQRTSEAINYMIYYSNNFLVDLKKELAYDPKTIAKGGDVQVTFDGPFYQSGSSNKCFFTRSYDYNLYLIDEKGISQVFKMLLPIDYSVPNDFLTNEEKYKAKRAEYLDVNRQKVYSISDVYNFEDYLFFKLNNNSYGEKNIFLYNLKTGSLLNLPKVSPDESTFFLPTITSNSSIKANDGNYIYSTFSSLELFNAHQAIKDKHPTYSAQLKRYFSTQTAKSNPIIVRLKLQPNL